MVAEKASTMLREDGEVPGEGGGGAGKKADPPLGWLLDVEVMPLASHIFHQVAGPLLKGPVGHQVGVIMLHPAQVSIPLIHLCALHITGYTLHAQEHGLKV